MMGISYLPQDEDKHKAPHRPPPPPLVPTPGPTHPQDEDKHKALSLHTSSQVLM